MRFGPFGEDDPDDSWSEVLDAQISRVDIVGQPANGARGFLLMKSGGPLMTPDQIRSLIAGSTSTQRESAMSDRIPGTNRPTTSALLRKAKAAAKSKMVAIYNSQGVLIGTVAEDKITVLADATDPKAAAKPKAAAAKPIPPAPQIPEDATDGPAAEVVKAIGSALAGARFRSGNRFAKGDVDARYSDLVKSVDTQHAGELGDAVAHSAMSLQFSSRMPGQDSVRLAKSIALDLAAVEAQKPRPSVEAASAALKRARPLR